MLTIVGAGVAVLMVLNNPDIDSTARPEIAWAAGASGIVGSALLAFCGYVLELLVRFSSNSGTRGSGRTDPSSA
jgi:membrane associated rhomboid family serine protease